MKKAMVAFFLLYNLCVSDYEQCSDHKDNPYWQCDKCVGHKAGDDIAHKADSSHRNGVGELCGYVGYMVALRACAGHNRGIRNWRAVISTYGSGHTGGNADDAKRISQRKYGEGNRNQNAERSPRGTCGECQERTDQEYDCGEEGLEAAGGILYQGFYKLFCAKGIGHRF